MNAKAGDHDHSPPESSDHLPPVVYICYYAAYRFDLQTGQKWSTLPARAEYVDLYYKKTYASFKYIYYWDRYLDPKTKKLCKGWCEKFNYANAALKKILEQKNKK